MIKQVVFAGAVALAAALPQVSQAATLLDEGFESMSAALASGWARNNLSTPVGLYGWGQAFGIFDAQAGSNLSYAQSNWQVADEAGGAIDNWLMTPTLSFDTQNTLSFWSRTSISPSAFADRMEVRLSTAGASTDAASFTTLLVTINPNLTGTDYPAEWTQYTLNFSASAGTSGRIGFRALMPDNTAHADIIGLDSVLVTAVPEPQTYALLLAGLVGVVGAARRRKAD